tara:strand:- start:206 stop:613 length:408 start_codon:yes stop_codon:yes gene_type:complete
MFKSFTTLNDLRPTKTTVGGRNYSYSRTVFSDNAGRCLIVRSVRPGMAGNHIIFNLVRMLANGTRYKSKLWVNGVAIKVITSNGDAGDTLRVIKNSINENADMKPYVRATLIKDSIGLFNSGIGFSNGQSMRGGR